MDTSAAWQIIVLIILLFLLMFIGACSSSTLKEASSWGKVDTVFEQMVYAEATTVVPLIASYIYHKTDWKNRRKFEWTKLFAK